MKQKFYTSTLIFSIILSICIVAGCSDGKAGGSKGVEKSRSTNVDIPGWPDDLPKFKDSKPVQLIKNDAGVLASAIFAGIKNPENAYKNYKKALLNCGWILDFESLNEVAWVGDFKKSSNSVMVNMQKDGSVAQLTYIMR